MREFRVSAFIFGYRGDAVMFLNYAKDYLETHKIITIRQINEFLAEPVTDDDETYGWTDLSEAWISAVPGGYQLHLPNMRRFKPIRTK